MDLREQARSCALKPDQDQEVKILLLALCGVADHRERELLEMEVKWRKAEYNYASTKLTQSNSKLERYKNDLGL